MPTHFTPTRLTIALVIVVLAGIGFKQTLLKQTLLAQHVGAVTKNAGLEISHCRNAETIPVSSSSTRSPPAMAASVLGRC
jgi:hypothetical protein